MANREGHRRFGNVRRRESGRYQIRYPGPDGRMRTGPDTYERKSDADRALVMIEAQIRSGEWTDPERRKVKLGDYASAWITERPGLRPRTMDLYRWLLRKHIDAHLGGAPVGKLSPRMIREWRATLLANGVSVSVAAKAYRLLRAILMTAVEDDNLLPRNPCRIRGAGAEDAGERPVLTVTQVFELAEQVGRRPVGNIRKLVGGYRLRLSRHGEMRTSPEMYGSRAEAERALWKMAADGRADCTHDRRFYALVLLATFASLRWGEATALRRCDLDLDAATVRVRASYVERSTGEMLLGPPRSQAGRRIVGIPAAIVPALREHLATFAKDDPGALAFPGAKGGGPLRRGNFNKMSAWPHAVESIDMTGLHFHDLRHTGNQFAAQSGARLRDLMARMGHDSERAAMIYQHEAQGADKAITNAIDTHVQTEQTRRGEDEDGSAGVLVPAG
ncbi:MAG TPA: tyrosine-type recombinase/integrase [Streptosporangiaceae bacterium]